MIWILILKVDDLIAEIKSETKKNYRIATNAITENGGQREVKSGNTYLTHLSVREERGWLKTRVGQGYNQLWQIIKVYSVHNTSSPWIMGSFRNKMSVCWRSKATGNRCEWNWYNHATHLLGSSTWLRWSNDRLPTFGLGVMSLCPWARYRPSVSPAAVSSVGEGKGQ